MSKYSDLLSAISSGNVSDAEKLILDIGPHIAFSRYAVNDFSGRTIIDLIHGGFGRGLWDIHPGLMAIAVKHSPFLTLGYKLKVLNLCNLFLGIAAGETSIDTTSGKRLAKSIAFSGRRHRQNISRSEVENLRNTILDTATPEDRKIMDQISRIPVETQTSVARNWRRVANVDELSRLLRLKYGDSYSDFITFMGRADHQTVEADLMERRTSNGEPPLYEAARKNSVVLARLLIESGADFKATNKHGVTPLHIAVQHNSTDVAGLLIKSGADIEATNNHGATPLHIAAEKNSVDVAGLLIESGADFKATDKDGFTPLHIAALYNSTDVARLLIESGADIEATNNHGATPLHIAAQSNSTNVARLLIESGADIEASTIAEWTPLYAAAACDSADVARLLVEHGANTDGLALGWINK